MLDLWSAVLCNCCLHLWPCFGPLSQKIALEHSLGVVHSRTTPKRQDGQKWPNVDTLCPMTLLYPCLHAHLGLQCPSISLLFVDSNITITAFLKLWAQTPTHRILWPEGVAHGAPGSPKAQWWVVNMQSGCYRGNLPYYVCAIWLQVQEVLNVSQSYKRTIPQSLMLTEIIQSLGGLVCMLEMVILGKSAGRLTGGLPLSRNIYIVAVHTVPCTKERSLNLYLFAIYETLSIIFSGLLIRQLFSGTCFAKPKFVYLKGFAHNTYLPKVLQMLWFLFINWNILTKVINIFNFYIYN